jgi:hypothetical protein
MRALIFFRCIVMMEALPWFTGWVILTGVACLITWKLTMRAQATRESETWALLYSMQAEFGDLTTKLAGIEREAGAYGDALNDIVDLADWTDAGPFASGIARVAEVLAIAKQALATGSYPGRLRAAQEALEQAERDLQELRGENVRLAELAVCPR